MHGCERSAVHRAARYNTPMPLYEYFCPKCTSKYELLRPMSRSDEPGTCPNGHAGGARTIATFARVGRAEGGDSPMPSSGGGCACGGGACGCGH
jgi:putative FmdB family regulatory protein